MSAELKTETHFNTAVAALLRAGFRYREGATHAGKNIGPDVTLRADIESGDERIVLRWLSNNGIELADPIRIVIDKNAEAFIFALSRVDVRR